MANVLFFLFPHARHHIILSKNIPICIPMIKAFEKLVGISLKMMKTHMKTHINSLRSVNKIFP